MAKVFKVWKFRVKLWKYNNSCQMATVQLFGYYRIFMLCDRR